MADPFEDARAVLPAPISYANVFVLPAAFVIALALCMTIVVITAWPLRRSTGMMWWDRARAGFAPRAASIILLVCVPALLALAFADFRGPLSRAPPAALFQATFAAALIGALPARFWIEHKLLGPRFTLALWLGGVAMQLAFSPTLLAALLTIACVDLGARPLWAGLVLVVATRFGGLRILRALRLARPSPRLLSIVERAAAGSPLAGKFRAYEMMHWLANAFAFPGSPIVLYTSAAMRELSDDEIEAICGHELAHTHEPGKLIFARRALGLMPSFFFLGLLGAVDGGAKVWAASLILILISGPLILVRPLLVRRLEARADRAAHKRETSVGDYGRALAHLHELNATPLVLNAKGTHGHPYDRLAAANVSLPPRPMAPDTRAVFLAAVLGCIGAPLSWGALEMALVPGADASDAALVRGVVMTGGESDAVLKLANERAANGRADAFALYRAAVATDLDSTYPPVYAARAYANVRDCAHAAEMIAEADRRVKESGRENGAALANARREVETCDRNASRAK